MYHVFIIYSLVEGQQGGFQFLAITNEVVITIAEQVSLWGGRASFRYMPRSGIAGS